MKETLDNLIPGKPIAINSMAPLEDVVQLMEEQRLINLPVVDIHNKLLGVIRYDTLVKTAKEDVTEDVQAIHRRYRFQFPSMDVGSGFLIKNQTPVLIPIELFQY